MEAGTGTDKSKVCGACGKEGAPLKCPCKAIFYCDAGCQRSSWADHREKCTWDLERKLDKMRQKLGGESFEVGRAAILLGELCFRQDKFNDADKFLSDGVHVFRTLYGENHQAVATGSSLLGTVYMHLGRLDESVAMQKRALRIWRKKGDGVKVANALTCLGSVLSKQGLHEQGMHKLEEAYDLYRSTYGEDHESVVAVLGNMASALTLQGKTGEALAMQEKGLDARIAAGGGGDDEAKARALFNLGTSLKLEGRLPEALARFEEAIPIVRRNRAERTALEGMILTAIGDVHRVAERGEEALAAYKQARTFFRKTLGRECEEVGMVLYDMATVLANTGKAAEAVGLLEEALGIRRSACGEGSSEVGDTLYLLGMSMEVAGDAEGGAARCVEAFHVFSELGETAKAAEAAAAAVRAAGEDPGGGGLEPPHV